jgi:predicted dehydrogenase
MNDTRRSFLKNSSVAAIGSTIAAPAILRGAPSTSTLKIGLIGAGGRGSGAAQQAMNADPNVKLWAVGEAFQDKADKAVNRFKKSHADKVDVPPERTFAGLDAFQKVIDSGVDVVLLATPPGFRPQHLRAAVEAKKHIFCEKPMATDAFGVRSVLESAKIAKANNTAITAGFCWRYDWARREAFKRIHEGEIGDIKAYYATYYTGVVKPLPKTPKPDDMGDIEWQVRNWYNYVWVGGGSLMEQAVHSGDKIAWAMKDETPVKCIANGGRAVKAPGGNIFDHYSCVYEYANGTRAFLASRQINNCANENSDYIMGTKGDCFIGKGPKPFIKGENKWRYEGESPNMYQVEHNELFASIRDGKVINDGERMAKSTMLALMGRMACHTGKEITWDQAINSQERRVPEQIDFDAAHEVPPWAVPGFTKFI